MWKPSFFGLAYDLQMRRPDYGQNGMSPESADKTAAARRGRGRQDLPMDRGQDYYAQDYYNYDQGYDLPQYGSRRKLIPPTYDEYGQVIMEDDGYYYAEPGRNKRIKLVVDQDTGSTAEDSGTDAPSNQTPGVPASHSNVNGNVYLSQNGTIVRTRRLTHPNNLKMGSPPGRLAKQFRKLDRLGVTHEESVPIDLADVTEAHEAENGFSARVSTTSSVDVNLNTQICCGSPGGSNMTHLKTFGSKGSITKSVGRPCGADELETFVDNHKGSGETLSKSHSEHTLSDEEELWMGPWNCLHIPMTKL
ncbi:hypothetical protein CRUP_028996 [Coryphaenoides rupestris]|nr:hypothetical protein CRUP_028996 [Coryphaenoides rupestris]